VAKATKNKKSKEGRHVGLDFYDLLIEEALIENWPTGAFILTGERAVPISTNVPVI
jgi:hypothetical protein